jgi:hypothetical protein
MTLEESIAELEVLLAHVRMTERQIEAFNTVRGALRQPLPWPLFLDVAAAIAAESTKRMVDSVKAALEQKHEHETDPEGRQICTTSGEAPSTVRELQQADGNTGQHKSYIVLCEEERQKGFVRPYRDSYQHVGIKVCGRRVRLDLPGVFVCGMTPEHEGACATTSHLEGVFTEADAVAVAQSHVLKAGCGAVTTMGRALSETYARDPKFYGSTFCVSCNKHFPVREFIWTTDGTEVGS